MQRRGRAPRRFAFGERGFAMRAVTVIGAGIGGLAAALALAQRGFAVQVCEQAPAITEVGAGIQVSPNGMAVLRGLGVAEAVRATAPRGRAVHLRDGETGRGVARLDLMRDAGDLDYRFVHRADLVEALAAACRDAGVTIRTGAKAAAVTLDPAPRIAFDDGTAIDAPLVVGADGARSVLRPVLNGARDPFFTRQVAWRAIVPNTIDHPAEAWVHMGPGRHMVTYPLRDAGVINLVAVEERRQWAAEGWSIQGDPDELRAAFAGFGDPARQILQGVAACGFWGLFRHPVAARWHGPGAVLLGDAAHPTLPFLAQGANMALEDAWVLAACLGADADQAAALSTYQARREKRVSRAIAAANGNAARYHIRNPLVKTAAHLGLRTISRAAPGALLRGFDWLYRHDVTEGAGRL